MSKTGNKEKSNISSLMRDWIGALILALVAALVFRTWFYTPYKVPTSSMIHTIQVGDHIFVNKHAYGYYSPFSGLRISARNVNRGDIVVFPYPVDPQVEYIKRVIGIGGDEIQIEGETVYINGELENTIYLYFDPELLKLPENIEVTVPEGKLWVMGDNRRNSKDSRYWGFVDETSVEGKAEMVFWSHDPSKNITEGYRFDRIGTFLE